jgi:hypothetical protein
MSAREPDSRQGDACSTPKRAGADARRAARARQRAYRRRKRNGLITLSIEIDHFEVVELLVEAGLLGQWDSENRAKVREVLEAALRSGALRIAPERYA